MKRILALVLAVMMVMALAACGGDKPTTTTAPNTTAAPETTAPETTAPETTEGEIAGPAATNSARDVLSAVWNNLPEDQKFFVGGGEGANVVDGDAGVVTDEAYITAQLHLPEELLGQFDAAASLIHGMNMNNMTVAAYHLVEGTDVNAFVESARTAIQGTHWMCGFPEQLIIATVGDVVVLHFGSLDNAETIKTNLLAVYPDAQILVDEAIMA